MIRICQEKLQYDGNLLLCDTLLGITCTASTVINHRLDQNMADFDSIWSPAKVFSPTAAKQASLQQKDWAYVDEFLASRFSPSPVPKFERNTDTLKALLALAAANEAADEEKLLERRVKEKALEELKKRDAALEEARKGKGEPLLAAVEENLTPEGRRCLNSAALMSVALATNSADPQKYAKLPYSAWTVANSI